MSPGPVKKVGLIPHLRSSFRYSGKTHYETRKTLIDRQPPKFDRSLRAPRFSSRSMDGKYSTVYAMLDSIKPFPIYLHRASNTSAKFQPAFSFAALGGNKQQEPYETEPSKRHTMSHTTGTTPDTNDERPSPLKKQKEKVNTNVEFSTFTTSFMKLHDTFGMLVLHRSFHWRYFIVAYASSLSAL